MEGNKIRKSNAGDLFPLIPTGDQRLDVIGSSGYGIYGDYCFRWPFVNLNPFWNVQKIFKEKKSAFFEGNFVNSIQTAFAAGIGWLITFCSTGGGNFIF